MWAFSYGIIKTKLTVLDPNCVALCRMAVAFLVFIPFIKYRKNKELIVQLIFIGAIQYGLMYLLVLKAYQYLDAYQVIFFTACTPFYVILFNTIYTRRLTIYHFVVAGLAILGGGIIYNTQVINENSTAGFFLVQLADICFAFGQIAYCKMRHNNPEVQDRDICSLLFLGAILISIIAITLLGGWGSMQQITLQQGLIIIYLGAIPSGLCFFWWNKGATRVHPVVLSVFNNLKLPLATIVSIVFFHENIKDGVHLIEGVIIIMFSLFLANKYQDRKCSSLIGVTNAAKKTI